MPLEKMKMLIEYIDLLTYLGLVTELGAKEEDRGDDDGHTLDHIANSV